MITIEVVCNLCGVTHKIVVPIEDYKKWQSGDFVQDAFPYLAPATRELLISGTCGTCFDKLFGEEDDE